MSDIELNPERIAVAAQRMVRCRRSGRYFDGEGWTEIRTKAQQYESSTAAAMACVEHNLEDVDLVVALPGNGQEIFSTEIR